MHELNKLLIKKHLLSSVQTQCLSPLGQMSYSQISPKCQEKQMIVSLTSGPLQEEWMWLIKCAIPPKKTSSVTDIYFKPNQQTKPPKTKKVVVFFFKKKYLNLQRHNLSTPFFSSFVYIDVLFLRNSYDKCIPQCNYFFLFMNLVAKSCGKRIVISLHVIFLFKTSCRFFSLYAQAFIYKRSDFVAKACW